MTPWCAKTPTSPTRAWLPMILVASLVAVMFAGTPAAPADAAKSPEDYCAMRADHPKCVRTASEDGSGGSETGTTTEPAPEAGSTVAVPATIPADCSRDASDDLTAFFAQVPDGATVVFPTDACYLTRSQVILRDRTGVTIDGNGATLRRDVLSEQELRYPRHNNHLRLINLKDAVIRGFVIRGTNDSSDHGGSLLDARGTARSVDCLHNYAGKEDWGCYTVALEFEHGVAIFGSTGVLLEDVTIDGVWGDGVYVSGHDEHSGTPSADTTIRRVTVERNGRQGIAIVRSRDALIEDVSILRGRRAGIDIEPDATTDAPITNIEIRNSFINTHLLAFASYGKGEVSDVFIHHNHIGQTGVPWVWAKAADGTTRYRWRVEDNVVDRRLDSSYPGVLFDNVRDVVYRGNRTLHATHRSNAAVGLYNGATASVTCNLAEGASPIVASDGSATWEDADNHTSGSLPGC